MKSKLTISVYVFALLFMVFYVALSCKKESINVKIDTDGDGIIDELDNCITIYNPEQIDTDGNGIGDDCEEIQDSTNFDNFLPVSSQVDQYELQGSKWNIKNLTYSFSNFTSDALQTDQINVFKQAFQKWSDVSSLRFTEIDSKSDIEILFAVGNHGDCCPFDGPSNVLAHAFYPPPAGGNLAGDCHFDDSEHWVISSSDGIDLLSVAMHEIGHSLGISHSAVYGAVMYAFYSKAKTSLHPDDIAAIQALYPPPTLSNWYISYGGNESWTDVNDSDFKLEDLQFGDIDGDGTTDIFISTGGRWYYSKMASSEWIQLATSRVNSKFLKLCDFNGDGKDDLLLADGKTWQVSYGVRNTWQTLNNSNYKLEDIGFGDFNGDGKTDIIRTDGGEWNVSWGGTSEWQLLNSTSYKLEDLGFGDFNGDGKTDIIRTDRGEWNVSWSGTTDWILLNKSDYKLKDLEFGDFNGDGKTDIFRTKN